MVPTLRTIMNSTYYYEYRENINLGVNFRRYYVCYNLEYVRYNLNYVHYLLQLSYLGKTCFFVGLYFFASLPEK